MKHIYPVQRPEALPRAEHNDKIAPIILHRGQIRTITNKAKIQRKQNKIHKYRIKNLSISLHSAVVEIHTVGYRFESVKEYEKVNRIQQ